MADINKDDMTSVFGVKKVGFGDTVSKSSSCCIVDQAEDVKIGDSNDVNNSSMLYLSNPVRAMTTSVTPVLSSLEAMSGNLPTE